MSASHHGPLMIDVAGTALTDDDRRRLRHPRVGGVILFSRNYAGPEQLQALTAEIHALHPRPLPIAIDHEGGRVQRCRTGFTRIPPMRELGRFWDERPQAAVAAAREIGYLLAAELRACGVDLSLTPVLDLDRGRSSVIGDRAFHRRPEVVIELARSLIGGLREAGMAAVGKHFPGHGFVEADSHLAIPVDDRPLAAMTEDIAPFAALDLDAVMPAHVIFPSVDPRPAGFSPVWIDYLRGKLGFAGAIFSDDLSMEGASVAGDIVGRANAAWDAGCDMLLVCNDPGAADRLLSHWHPSACPDRAERVAGLVRYRRPLAADAGRLERARSLCAQLAPADGCRR